MTSIRIRAVAIALALAPSLAPVVARAADVKHADDRGARPAEEGTGQAKSGDDAAETKRCRPCNGGAYCCRY